MTRSPDQDADSSAVADVFLPEYQFSERHEGLVMASPEQVLASIAMLDDRDEPLVRLLLTLREAPARLLGILGRPSALRGKPRFGIHDFTLLRRTDDAVVYGLVGRFWRLDFGLATIENADDFMRFDRPGFAKLVLSIRASAQGPGVRVSTETRVYCPDRRSRLLFSPYWILIRPASGFIRRRLLARIAEESRRAKGCPTAHSNGR